ncbi:hypothetical protein SAMD00023353_2101070 [Rosellinia necatrix]|uniref:Uncharacterized protein n=1 Tax=Rosellinia necatrix TaxID=77044 RepID=A0A1S8A7P0_ROSNE|nr:hypothetical protein SAMD00023353_2101070 [Rosellinia necatrix]
MLEALDEITALLPTLCSFNEVPKSDIASMEKLYALSNTNGMTPRIFEISMERFKCLSK